MTAAGAAGRRVAVVGGGILGAAVARRVLQVEPDARVTLLEKEDGLARHQTGRNSGVVHAGLYYAPGSLKARLCRRGVALLREFCQENDLVYDECGKVLVALDRLEETRLDAMRERALANGVPGVRVLGAEALQEIEPHVRGVAGLHSPHTAIVDYAAVTRALAAQVELCGGRVAIGVEVTGLDERAGEVVVRSSAGGVDADEAYDVALVCAGLHADRVAGFAGTTPTRRSSPSGGSTTCCGRSGGSRSETWSTQCPTRATRSSAFT